MRSVNDVRSTFVISCWRLTRMSDRRRSRRMAHDRFSNDSQTGQKSISNIRNTTTSPLMGSSWDGRGPRLIRIVVVFYRRASTRTGRLPVIRYNNPYERLCIQLRFDILITRRKWSVNGICTSMLASWEILPLKRLQMLIIRKKLLQLPFNRSSKSVGLDAGRYRSAVR